MSQPEPLTEQQLNDIEARINAATPGPWMRKTELASHIVYVDNAAPNDGTSSPLWNAEWATEADGEFTAHARTDVPALLAEVRRLRTESAAVAAFLDEQDRAARLFELPTPAWVEAVRAASGATVVPLSASQPSEAPVEPETPTKPPTGRQGDSLPAEDFTGTQPCGHDDYHNPHPWADRPDVWCPGHSYADDQAASQETSR
jgi:hypothetical protein